MGIGQIRKSIGCCFPEKMLLKKEKISKNVGKGDRNRTFPPPEEEKEAAEEEEEEKGERSREIKGQSRRLCT